MGLGLAQKKHHVYAYMANYVFVSMHGFSREGNVIKSARCATVAHAKSPNLANWNRTFVSFFENTF